MNKQRTQNIIKTVAGTLLLFGYFLNVVSFESFHQAVHHHHHTDLHSTEAETNACHRAIYHGESSQDCDHKSHITKTETECELCKVTVSRFFYSSTTSAVLSEQFDAPVLKPASTEVFGCNFSLVYAPRGPPTLS